MSRCQRHTGTCVISDAIESYDDVIRAELLRLRRDDGGPVDLEFTVTPTITSATHVDKQLVLRSVRVPAVRRLVDAARVVGRRAVASSKQAEYQLSDVNVARRTTARSDVEHRFVVSEALRQLALETRHA